MASVVARLRRALRIAAVVAIAFAIVALLTFIAFAREAERYTAGLAPEQFHRTLDRDLLADYAGVFGVAHNSGDSIEAAAEAIRHGADVIEIDVVSIGDELYAGHDSPLPLLGKRFFRGPKLIEVWDEARAADAVKLDLKESSKRYLALVFAFLRRHRAHDVVVASRDLASLRGLRERAPWAVRLLSVPNEQGLDALEHDDDLQQLIDGVTVRDSLVTADRAAWLQRRDLIVLAWTVNESERLNELVRAGVDAVTTDNLAIMELLGGQQRDEATLTRRSRREQQAS